MDCSPKARKLVSVRKRKKEKGQKERKKKKIPLGKEFIQKNTICSNSLTLMTKVSRNYPAMCISMNWTLI